MRILFVCMGNICRSPTAEGVFASLLREEGLRGAFEIDSAGTGGWHAGEARPTRGPRAPRLRAGSSWTGAARQVRPADFTDFDLLVAMDGGQRPRSCARSRRTPTRTGQGRLLLREYDPRCGGGRRPRRGRPVLRRPGRVRAGARRRSSAPRAGLLAEACGGEPAGGRRGGARAGRARRDDRRRLPGRRAPASPWTAPPSSSRAAARPPPARSRPRRPGCAGWPRPARSTGARGVLGAGEGPGWLALSWGGDRGRAVDEAALRHGPRLCTRRGPSASARSRRARPAARAGCASGRSRCRTRPATTGAAFYAERRIRPLAERAERQGALPGGRARGDRGRVRPHGRTWSGRLSRRRASTATCGAATCWPAPAASRSDRPRRPRRPPRDRPGDARLFGRRAPRLLPAYEELRRWPTATPNGSRAHQLFPLLVHAVLFGGGYREPGRRRRAPLLSHGRSSTPASRVSMPVSAPRGRTSTGLAALAITRRETHPA